MLRPVLLAALLLIPPLPSRAPELVRPEELVTAWRGDLPLILSAPHGGRVRVPGGKQRSAGESVRDEDTAELALLLSQQLTDRLGGKPYVVIAQFSRKDADANRPAEEAFELECSAVHWRAYHSALEQAVSECRERFGEALLIDIHGQAKEPAVIARGTRDGRTLRRLEQRKGAEWLHGAPSLGERLRARGYDVAPRPNADGSPARETLFNGGYIVAHYGGMREQGIDAVQLEFGRQREDLLRLSADCGAAIADFLREAGYLRPR